MYLDYMFRCNNVGWRLCPKMYFVDMFRLNILGICPAYVILCQKCILWTCLVGDSGGNGGVWLSFQGLIQARIDSGKD